MVYKRKHCCLRHSLFRAGVLNCPCNVLHHGTLEVVYIATSQFGPWCWCGCHSDISNQNFAPYVLMFYSVCPKNTDFISTPFSGPCPIAWITQRRARRHCQSVNEDLEMRKTATSDSLHLHPILVPVFYMGYPKQLVVPNWTTSSVHCAHEDICKDQGTRWYSNLVLTCGQW